MTLHVLDPGLYSLVVDRGRPRTRSLGVPVGGAADRMSYLLGNALVGNAPEDAALEISLSGPTLEARNEMTCVVSGAPFDLLSDRQRLRTGKTFILTPGERLEIAGTVQGTRAYLCVRGGLQVPMILASRTGLSPLRGGEELPCPSSRAVRARFLRPLEGKQPTPVVLRVLDGAQAAWFAVDALCASPFTVSPASNRMGLRLQGTPLALPARELVSEPVCPGAVQVTRDGQCIILGVDGQTIGGYPKIAQVISADLDRLGQLRPAERVRFQRVTLAEAELLHRQRQAILREWTARLRATEALFDGSPGG